MKTKKKKKATRRRQPPPPAERLESQAAVAFTVAWTVSLTAVVTCDLAILVTGLIAPAGDAAASFSILHRVLLVAGALVGLIALSLLGIVLKTRRTAPPQGLMVFGVLVSIAPLAALILKVVS